MQKIIILISFMTLLLNACVNKNEEDLFVNCNTDNVKYATHIQPILQNRCYVCHSQSVATAGIVLEGYNNVQPKATSGILVDVIEHNAGVTPMPYNLPKIPQCEIEQIKKWVNEGALNN